MKKSISLVSIIGIVFSTSLWCSFEALQLPTTIDDQKTPIKDMSSFCFITAANKTYCYALVEQGVIRIDVNNLSNNNHWEHIPIPFPAGTIISLFSLGSHLGILMDTAELATRENWESKKPITVYDPLKNKLVTQRRVFDISRASKIYVINHDNIERLLKSPPASLFARLKEATTQLFSNFGLEEIYSSDIPIHSCTGFTKSDTGLIIFAKTVDPRQGVIMVSRIGKKIEEKQTSYSYIAIPPAHDYIWLFGFTKDQTTKLRIEDLEDFVEGFEEFETEEVAIQNLPPVDLIVALDQNTAFFSTKTQSPSSYPPLNNIYKLTSNGVVSSLPSDINYSNVTAFGILDNKLIIAINNALYKYIALESAPKIKQPIIPEADRHITQEASLAPIMPSSQTALLNPKVFPPLTVTLPEAAETPPAANPASTEKLIAALRPPRLNISRPSKQQPQQAAAPQKEQEEKPKKEAPRSTFTPQQQNSLMSLYRSPLFQKMIKSVIGNSLYNTFLKTKSAHEKEKEALTADPKPWEKYLEKPSYVQQYQNWLYKNTRGYLGKKLEPTLERYNFPENKAGKRSQLLYKIYSAEGSERYQNICLNKTDWDAMKPSTKQLLRGIDNTEPAFGEYWLQQPLSLRKKSIAPAA